jgi:hypothetical protein
MGEACNTHGRQRNVYKVLVGKPEGKSSRGDPRVARRIILERILGKSAGKEDGSCEHGNEPSSSKKGGEFLE